MERDCLIAHGVGSFLVERLCKVSDPFKISVCKKCGVVIAGKNCHMCQSNETSVVGIPYASKLLFQELQAMALKIVIKPGDN